MNVNYNRKVTQTPCQIPNSDKIILLYKRKISFLQDFQFNFIFQNKWKTFKIEEDFLIGLYSLRVMESENIRVPQSIYTIFYLYYLLH